MTLSPPTAPVVPIVYDKDGEHLRTLSIFWFIIAGIKTLAACFLLLYLVIGLVMAFAGVAAGAAASSGAHDPGAAVIGIPLVGMGLFFAFFGGFMLLLLLTLAFLDFKCGQSLRRRRHYTLCFVMACLVCLSVPFGTILGVFSLIVLSREGVKASFS